MQTLKDLNVKFTEKQIACICVCISMKGTHDHPVPTASSYSYFTVQYAADCIKAAVQGKDLTPAGMRCATRVLHKLNAI